MLKAHLKAAWIQLSRNKMFTLLNLSGLVISLTALTLMALFIEDEWSFDSFHENASRIYRVVDDKQTPNISINTAETAAPVGPNLSREFPEIQQAVRVMHADGLMQYEENIYNERSIYFADPSIFDVFSFRLKEGNPAEALNAPGKLIMSVTAAKKYFGKQTAIGKTVTLDGENLLVTGVIEDVPANSHLQFDFLVSMATAEKTGSGYDWLFSNWYSNMFYTYILLPKDYDVRKLSSQMPAFDQRHKEKNGSTTHLYQFEKLSDVYLRSNRSDQADKVGQLSNIYIMSVVAIFILTIACINFINLSTARAMARAKEVGIKKVTGASRAQMIVQFLIESSIVASAAIIISLAIAQALIPAFNHFTEKSVRLNLVRPDHLFALFSLFFLISILSGIYPAMVISRFNPAIALKGKSTPAGWSATTRKSLVVFQFAVSVTLIICSCLVFAQLRFMQQYHPGFKPSQTMVLNFEGDSRIKPRLEFIKKELSAIPGVRNISSSSNVPGDGKTGAWSMDIIKKTGDTIHTEIPVYAADFNFLKQLGVPVIAGRPLSQNYAGDSTESMLISETAVRALGFEHPEQVLGLRAGMYPNDGIITGVFRDFHFESLQRAMAPLAIRYLPDNFRLLSVELNGPELLKSISAVESTWKRLAPERPLEYSFIDENFRKSYTAELKFGQVFAIFTGMAIVIACLGLFGLALFSIQQRVKEIGVRKVLGASTEAIAIVLSRDYIRLIIIAVLIAIPVSAFFMNRWLADFAYRTPLPLGVFVVAPLAAIFVALATISVLTLKAARANPVQSLRNE
ncbi:ABC transporter permease [Pollutibacter soli]|uniref:ABC transporter permease n=1 Tax=Pollutibacter soli TaxID=3034157 RepID=UPI0030136AE2